MATKISTVLCFVFFLGIQALSAQVVLTPGQVASAPGVDPIRLKRVDQVIQEFTESGKIVGAIALVVKDGKVLIHKGYGVDDRNSGKAMAPDAIVRIASQTKALTSTGILMLMEDGKLLLNDPVHKYIPTFKNLQVIATYQESDTTYTTVPAKRDITIRDLLTHTSGLGYPSIGSPMMKAVYAKNKISAGIGETGGEMAEAMLRLGTLPLEHQPGERWTYGLNSDVLGHIIEIVSGMSLEEFFRKRICEPLGMVDTWFNLPASKHSRLSRIYLRQGPGSFALLTKENAGVDPDFPKQAKTYFSGGAGLSSTALDYARFLQLFLNKGVYGTHRLLSPATVAMMTRNQAGNLYPEGHFGYGFSVVSEANPEDIRNRGSFAWGGAFGTRYWADPKANLIGIILTQQYVPGPETGELMDKFKVAVYQALTK